MAIPKQFRHALEIWFQDVSWIWAWGKVDFPLAGVKGLEAKHYWLQSLLSKERTHVFTLGTIAVC